MTWSFEMPYLYELKEADRTSSGVVVEGLDYLAETNLTASNTFSPENVGVIEFTAALAAVIHAAEEMDKFKKALFRKRSREESNLAPRDPIDPLLSFALGVDVLGDPCPLDNLFHGVVGAITEVGEMAEILLHHLDGTSPEIDRTNVREEIGDVLWYLSRLVTYSDTTFLTEMRRNVDKLRLRHGTAGFNKEADINRNLDEERALLEGDPTAVEPEG
jgi:NTP pyrophosphatase (non-canonical NTP hydrolase)